MKSDLRFGSQHIVTIIIEPKHFPLRRRTRAIALRTIGCELVRGKMINWFFQHFARREEIIGET
eukprot:scaffold147166_cov44-Attheya_sp.AAC.2